MSGLVYNQAWLLHWVIITLLWSPYGIGQTIIFSCCYLFFVLSLFSSPNLSRRRLDGCLPYFRTWCGLSANLRCRSETCCTRLAENTGRKKSRQNRHLGTIAQLCRAISSELRHVSTIGKKLVKQQYVLHVSPQYGELRPTSGWDRFTSLGHPSKFSTAFASWQHYCTALVVGVSQTLQRWTEGATYIRHGDHHVGHWPTF